MNKKRRKFLIAIMIIVFILVAVFCHHIVKIKFNENKIINLERYLFFNEDRRDFNIMYINDYSHDASRTLEEVLAGFYTWDQLPLTNHFKDKFKYNRHKIIKDVCDIEYITSTMTEKDGAEYIEILGDMPDNILTDVILPPIRTIYLFKYNVVDGKLDDVELVERYNVDATTGKRFFVKDDSGKFEP